MNLSQLESSLDRISDRASTLTIAGNFYQNKSRFLILGEHNGASNLARLPLLPKEISNATVVGQFQFEKETYFIVKEPESIATKESHSTEVLTARELQIATLVARGKSNKQIAKQLQISKWTVSTHLRRIFMKLQVDNRAAMVYQCFGFMESLFFVGRSR